MAGQSLIYLNPRHHQEGHMLAPLLVVMLDSPLPPINVYETQFFFVLSIVTLQGKGNGYRSMKEHRFLLLGQRYVDDI